MATRRSRSWMLAVLSLAGGLALAVPGWTSARGRADEASPDSMYHRALERLARNTPEHRQGALRDLEQAARLAGDRADILNAVAMTYAGMGHHRRARGCLDRLARVAPDDADAQQGLGQLWKWEWLASIELSSYRKALECFLRACRLDSTDLESRLAVTALALARHDVDLGMMAARSAMTCDPDAAETALAMGCALYRTGDLARADRAFRAAVPRLPTELRSRFTDLGAIRFNVAPAPLETAEVDRTAEAFWAGSDPDLTTPENEARLDFIARVAHAALLFRGRQGVQWDMRAELFARYGIPASVELPPPPGPDEGDRYLAYIPSFARGGLAYPYHKQTWIYPELGIRVELWDQSLDESYRTAVSAFHNTDASPRPERLAARPDLVALDGGRGVYRALPPGVTYLPARGGLAVFPSDSGARLVAHLETAGGPADTLWGAWAVVGADDRTVARGSGVLSVSACDPGARRIAQFEAVVPPGDYRVHLTVDDRRGRRGLTRLASRVAGSPPALVMSDLVPVCGTALASPGSPVRIEPDLDRRITGSRAITVYFEIDHLSLDPQGMSRFTYRYALKPVDPDAGAASRADAAIEASREEEHVGARRRQFVSVPTPSLAPGTYELAIEVRDLASGATVTRSVRLVK